MNELISILILFYTVQGVEMESEMPLPSAQCEAAERGITAAVGGKGGPRVELWNGRKVPVKAASCLHACVTEDILPDLDLISDLRIGIDDKEFVQTLSN